jgi:hypothetical protein
MTKVFLLFLSVSLSRLKERSGEKKKKKKRSRQSIFSLSHSRNVKKRKKLNHLRTLLLVSFTICSPPASLRLEKLLTQINREESLLAA